MTVFGGAGGRSNEGRMQVDGLNAGAGARRQRRVDLRGRHLERAGSRDDDVGRSGRSRSRRPVAQHHPEQRRQHDQGRGVPLRRAGGMVGSNYSDELQQRGPDDAGHSCSSSGTSPFGIGGPIMKDRLWYYVTARDEGQHRSIPSIYPNLNAGDPTKCLYVPDTSREVRGAESWQLYRRAPHGPGDSREQVQRALGRAASRATARRIGTTGDGCRNQPDSGAVFGPLGLGGLTSTTSPETGGYLDAHPTRAVADVVVDRRPTRCCSRRASARIRRPSVRTRARQPDARSGSRHRACAAGCSANGGIPNLTYRSANWGAQLGRAVHLARRRCRT